MRANPPNSPATDERQPISLPDGRELPDQRVTTLREAGVRYDRSTGGGEFYQLYTDLIGDEFFVEVVQRAGDYSGYGAVNAPTRMAAQR